MDDRTYLQLDPGEEILLTRHRHIVNILPIFVAAVLVTLFAVFGTSVLTANQDQFPSFISVPMISLGLLVLAGLSWLLFVVSYLIYLQTRIILTNKHYIQVTQNGLFGRTVSKLSLDEIQDVRGTRKGLLPTIFNYGEILIETAGKEENFFFRPVTDPLDLAETINDAHHKFGHLPPLNT
jgi:uncharacterized membrane protein YdbT with pleckstrin-like domain